MNTSTREQIRSRVTEALCQVYDPEPGVNVLDLGLVYRFCQN